MQYKPTLKGTLAVLFIAACYILAGWIEAWPAQNWNAEEWNQQQYEWQQYVKHNERIKQRNLQIQRQKSRINSYNRNKWVPIQPSNPSTYVYPPPTRKSSKPKTRMIGRGN